MARIVGKPGYDELAGTSGGDMLYGLGGSDIIYGGRDFSAPSGKDTFYGGAGFDSMYGGDGDDLFLHNPDGDYMVGGAGFDTLDYSSATTGFFIQLNSANSDACSFGDTTALFERLIGSRFGDTLYGGYERHTELFGGGGNDSIEGQFRADKLYGGVGNDTIRGTETLYGGADFGDSIFGGGGNDLIYGSEKADRLMGEDGRDTIYGDDGTDRIFGGSGGDWLAANRGDDSVHGGQGADTFFFSSSELGHRVVLDFKPGQGDKLYLEFGGNITSIAELLPLMTEKNGNVFIDMSTWNPGLYTVTIQNTDIADLTDLNVDFWQF